MVEWIAIAAGYVAALVVFRWLGGFGSAGRAVREWGSSRTSNRVASGASS